MGPDFRQKIKTAQQVAEIIGRRPREKTVVMCHGVFDIVHPGHLRHLTYAREKADVLIASITGDAQITKANYRPYVPQELRATNLAALEIVDYVIIDQHATPIENIGILQPDLFAKGYEYFANGLPPKTQDEITALQGYGGEILFTPGDVVYSSSALIEEHPPKIAVDKLLILMESEGITFGDLRQTLDRVEGTEVHVVGDTIVDSYCYCSLLGATAKSPTLSVRYEHRDVFAGGAAAVAQHMRAAGATVALSTVLGEDEPKQFVERALGDAGVQLVPVIDKVRPTPYKERFFAEGYKLLQVDRVDNRTISEHAVRTLEHALASTPASVVVFSDFRHGIFNSQNVRRLRACIPPDALKVADSQVSSRWGNILDFTEFDLLTPNEREARFALGDQDSVVRPLALKLFQQARCRSLILKLAERGLIGYRTPGNMPREFFTIDSFADHVVDPIGAGDALLAYAALGQRVTEHIVIAAILGSVAAAISCERAGNVSVSPREVHEKLDAMEKLAVYR